MFLKKCRRGIRYCKTVTIRQPKAPPQPRALSSDQQFGIELTQTPKPLTLEKSERKRFRVLTCLESGRCGRVARWKSNRKLYRDADIFVVARKARSEQGRERT